MLILFGSLLLIPFALNFIASRDDYRRYVDALFISGMLAGIWAFTNGIATLWPFPENKQWHPLIDLIGLSVVVAAYMTQKQRWKLLLAFLFLAQLLTHVWFWAHDPASRGSIGREYVGTLNLLWFAQLGCVAWSGGVHCVARTLDVLRRHRRLPDLVRH